MQAGTRIAIVAAECITFSQDNTIMMTNDFSTRAAASRFLQRWQEADPARVDQLAGLVQLSLSPSSFAQLLQKESARDSFQDSFQDSVRDSVRDSALDPAKESIAPGSTPLPLPRAMRRLRNLIVCTLIWRDLNGLADLDEVVRTMSAFADFAVQTHLTALTAELQALHGKPIGDESGTPQSLIVLGMGKLGGGELNVSSDIDLIFVYPEDGETRTTDTAQRSLSNQEFFNRLGRRLIGDISAITEDGFTFRVDMALRPNGVSGPLVASFGMLEQYLLVQGREWERYAWVKARALCGEAASIIALDNIIRPFVYRRYLDFGSIDAIRGMHRQIRAEVTRVEALHPERSNNVKLGRGGIREIEFLVQVFQLIRGGRDALLRDRSTRITLSTLAQKNLLLPSVVGQLLVAYTFLRNLEHRLQYLDDAQTHTLPAKESDRLLVAQMMGFADSAALLHELDLQRTLVSSQFDAIFADRNDGGPTGVIDELTALSQPTTTLSADERLDTIRQQLGVLGYIDPASTAARLITTCQSARIQRLPELSRKRLLALIDEALPVIARANAAQLETLNRLLNFLETIASRAAYLALLTEYPQALRRVIRMMQASHWAATYLTKYPLLLDELLDDRTLRAASDWMEFARDVQLQLDASPGDTERQMDTLREMHHVQTLHFLAQDLEGHLPIESLSDQLSTLADVLVQLTLQAVWQTLPNRHRDTPLFAVIAYGKLGSKELGYASDLDIIFLYDDDHPDAPALYARLAQRFISWMTTPTSAGILFDIDIALRPDGASGLLVSTVAAFEKYQRQSAWSWEHQALTRARFCAGEAAIGTRFDILREKVLRQPRVPSDLRREVLSMRRKMLDAHRPKPLLFDLKQESGGMIDIEFIVQFLILLNASVHPQLVADIGNIALLHLAGELHLIDTDAASAVADAYRTYRKLQHQARLQGEERTLVAVEFIQPQRDAVQLLWHSVFA